MEDDDAQDAPVSKASTKVKTKTKNVHTKKTLNPKVSKNTGNVSDNVADSSSGPHADNASLVIEGELACALLRMGITNERNQKNEQGEQNVCLMLHPEHPLFVLIQAYEKEYDDVTYEKQQDVTQRYQLHPLGKKHKALVRVLLLRLQQFLESDADTYAKLMGDLEDPGSLQEELLCIKDRAAEYQKDCNDVKCTRCYYVKYHSYELGAIQIKFIMYFRQDSQLQYAFEELMEWTEDLSPYNIAFVKDELPISADARYCQRRLNEYYAATKGKGKGKGYHKGKAGGNGKGRDKSSSSNGASSNAAPPKGKRLNGKTDVKA
eukprot:gnl/MRDRNA2_/MRDRNA2_136094_c0_seq1.p1 gnl/MRDRNA2_/MRDRNA2_136094_c0~~gnl/MRDRNA2_/MRDRNA2_136094_c0_seq1.p1  ORF type:complete len:342 (-),score=92.36 gnl/MRDRNA2_/MRDRNA2_136094_c0_seq1:94-1053(-)